MPPEFEYLKNIYKGFIGKFRHSSIRSQFTLARDYADRGLFANAFLLLTEALLSWAVDKLAGADKYKDKEARSKVAKELNKDFETKKKMGVKFIRLYTDIKLDVRNNIAHCGMETNTDVNYNPRERFYQYFDEAEQLCWKKTLDMNNDQSQQGKEKK